MSIIIDPWATKINNLFLSTISSRQNIEIIGPINKFGNRINLNFIFYKSNSNTLIISYSGDFDIRCTIFLNKNYAKINHIEKIIQGNIQIYSGSDIMKLLLKILKDIGIQEVELDDQSHILCKNRINNTFGIRKENLIMNKNYRNIKQIFTNRVPYDIISLLKYNRSFYMKYSFNPYIDDTNKTNNIKDLIYKLKTVKWDDIENLIIAGERTIKFIINGDINIIQNKIGYTPRFWSMYWSIIRRSFDLLKIKSININGCNSPFKALEIFNIDDCKIFINWLELYSLNFLFFKEITYPIYNNNRTIKNINIPLKQDFINIIDFLKEVKWKIKDLQLYNLREFININTL